VSAVRLLLQSAIDYAGLFPPAALPMEGAVREYAREAESEVRWALGRFVVPATRLGECLDACRALGRDAASPIWSLSVTLSDDLPGDLARLRLVQAALPDAALRLAALEARVFSTAHVERLAAGTDAALERYAEVPWDDRLGSLVDDIAAFGLSGKIRMGGVTASAFPPPDRVVAFLDAAVRARLPFKATAGLHHPWRGEYRLTYDEASPRTVMYGYLNLIVAALLLWRGGSRVDAHDALLDDERGAVRADAGSLRWRGHAFDRDTLARFRREVFQGFGSCSFREPAGELADAIAP
jgi:hypothetical protein